MQRRKLLGHFINGYVNSKRLPLKPWQDFFAKGQREQFLQGKVLKDSSKTALSGKAFLQRSFSTFLCRFSPGLGKP